VEGWSGWSELRYLEIRKAGQNLAIWKDRKAGKNLSTWIDREISTSLSKRIVMPVTNSIFFFRRIEGLQHRTREAGQNIATRKSREAGQNSVTWDG
jgi:hypothetical protein